MSFITTVEKVAYDFEEDTFTDQAVLAIEDKNLALVKLNDYLTIAVPVTELIVHQVAEMDNDGFTRQSHCSTFNYN